MKPTDLNEANWRSGGGGGVSLCCARWEGAGHIQIVIKMADLVWSLLLPEGNSLEKRSVGRTLGDRAQRQREC